MHRISSPNTMQKTPPVGLQRYFPCAAAQRPVAAMKRTLALFLILSLYSML